MLTTVDCHGDKKAMEQAHSLYLQAFPKSERVPWWVLRLLSRREGIDLTAWMDKDVFCGFTCSVTVDGLYFPVFFAVNEALRGKGYGSQILTQIRQAHSRVSLNVEVLDPSAPNYPERQRRFAFYQKNGFVDTHYHVWEVGGKFRILSTQPEVDEKQYRAVFQKMTWGLWRVRLQKVTEEMPKSQA